MIMSDHERKYREVTINYWEGGEWKTDTYRILLPIPVVGDEVELWTNPFRPPDQSEVIGVFTVTHRQHSSVGKHKDYSTGITLWLEQNVDLPRHNIAV